MVYYKIMQSCIYGIPSIWLDSNRLWPELSKCGNYLEIWFEGNQVPPEMGKCLTNMIKTVTAIYMKVVKLTTMMVPIMIISDLKIIQKTLLWRYIFCCCLPGLLLRFSDSLGIDELQKTSGLWPNMFMGPSQHLRWSSLWHYLTALCL